MLKTCKICGQHYTVKHVEGRVPVFDPPAVCPTCMDKTLSKAAAKMQGGEDCELELLGYISELANSQYSHENLDDYKCHTCGEMRDTYKKCACPPVKVCASCGSRYDVENTTQGFLCVVCCSKLGAGGFFPFPSTKITEPKLPDDLLCTYCQQRPMFEADGYDGCGRGCCYDAFDRFVAEECAAVPELMDYVRQHNMLRGKGKED